MGIVTSHTGQTLAIIQLIAYRVAILIEMGFSAGPCFLMAFYTGRSDIRIRFRKFPCPTVNQMTGATNRGLFAMGRGRIGGTES